MKILHIPFSTEWRFSTFDVKFAENPSHFSLLNPYNPSADDIIKAAELRTQKADLIDRNTLVATLTDQYRHLNKSSKVQSNLAGLNQSQTVGIVTAHQPILMGGPLFIAYKILSTIHLSNTMNEKDSNHTYVPIFVIGSEDHDKEEINHFYHYNQRIEWHTKQEGPVGRFKTEELSEIFVQLLKMNENNDFARTFLTQAKVKSENASHYAEWFQWLLNEWFGDYGLIVINMDDRSLKQRFVDTMRLEIEANFSNRVITKAQKIKTKLGFKEATFLRDINLFYMPDAGGRYRIEANQGFFEFVGLDHKMSKQQILEELTENPHRFSPNVNLRPLYQESILPGVAYVGGGGEVAYWLERKEQFDEVGIPFPVIIRRDSAFWLDYTACKKIKKLGLALRDLLLTPDQWIKRKLMSENKRLIDLSEEMLKIQEIFEIILDKATSLDSTLKGSVEAEKSKAIKGLEHLQQKLLKTKKNQNESLYQQFITLHQKMFPNGAPQERHESGLDYFLRYGSRYFDDLLASFDPLRRDLKVILEDDELDF